MRARLLLVLVGIALAGVVAASASSLSVSSAPIQVWQRPYDGPRPDPPPAECAGMTFDRVVDLGNGPSTWTAPDPAASYLVLGGNGPDSITGGSGADCIVGDNGPDTLHGGPGADVLIGGAGPDTCDGGGQSGDVVHECEVPPGPPSSP